MKDGLKIISAEITNFKNLSHKEIDFGGRSMMVVGPNMVGKSSLIQAIMCSLDSSYKPLSPIKKGEERAQVSVVLGGMSHGKETTYTVEMYFSPENQKGRLVLLDSEGKKVPSPQSSLDMIIGNIGFDIDEFIALSKTKSGAFSKEGAMKQVEILKAFLPMEIRKELFQLDVDIKEIKDSRTEINRQIKELTEKQKHEYTDAELELYSTPKPIDKIQEKLKNIGEASQKYAKAVATGKSTEIEIMKLERDIASTIPVNVAIENLEVIENLEGSIELENNQLVSTFMVHVTKFKSELLRIVDLSKKIPALQDDLAKIVKWLSKNEEPKSELILQELNDANAHNEECKKVAALKLMREELEEKQINYQGLATDITVKQQRKKEIFASNPLPVKDLSFDEEQVLYKELPFNDEQQPSSVIIGVGVRIAMAMNPHLKVIIIKDGSLLDKKVANGILKMIEKDGYQLFIEMVDREGSEMEIKFIEKEIL